MMPSTIVVVARGSWGWIHTGFGGIGTWEEWFGHCWPLTHASHCVPRFTKGRLCCRPAAGYKRDGGRRGNAELLAWKAGFERSRCAVTIFVVRDGNAWAGGGFAGSSGWSGISVLITAAEVTP